jgi:ABC-type polysaccharide/polyol phosphate export permease
VAAPAQKTLPANLAEQATEPPPEVQVPDEPRPGIWFKRRQSLRHQLREVWKFREFGITLAERDLRSRYKQAVLGFAWALITPLLLMVAFTLIFTKFAKVDSHGIAYPVYSYVALIPWTFFSTSVTNGASSMVTNLPLLQRIYCPRELFPVSTMLGAAVDAVLSVFVVGILFVVTGTVPALETLYVPMLLLVLIVFALAVTLACAGLLVYFRDLRYALPLLLQFVLLATPVGYGFEAISSSRRFTLLYSALNPLAPVIDGFRRVILFGSPPDWLPFAIATAVAFLELFGAYKLFKRLETGFADIA